MAINLKSLITSQVPGIQTITKATSAAQVIGKTATGLPRNPASNLNQVLDLTSDIDTAFAAPMVVALDPGINNMQTLINSKVSNIDPRLALSVAGLAVASKASASGLDGLKNSLPSMSSLLDNKFKNIPTNIAASKLGYATNVLSPGLPTSISNITNPLSNTLGGLGASVSGQITGQINSAIGLSSGSLGASVVGSAVSSLTNSNSALGKISNVVNTVNTVKNIAQNPGAALGGLASSAIQNTIGNKLGKLGALANLGLGDIFDPISKLTSLGKGLSDLNDFSKIVIKGRQELSSLTGGYFEQIENRVVDLVSSLDEAQSYLLNSSGYDDAVLNIMQRNNIPIKKGNDGSNKFGNKLRQYSSCNYVITLGVLSPNELNFPNTYLNNGLQAIICKSSGGSLGQRITTFSEGDEHAEYYIEDLSINSVIAPNPDTGVSMGTNVSFKIIEPYSMGKFLEAIRETAASLNFGSFARVPFCLKIEFTGYDENGDIKADHISPSYIPIMINKADFSVDGQGSTYDVTGVIYTEVAYEDSVDEVKTNVSAQGTFVHEVLENADNSVTRSINDTLEFLEENTSISGYDRYLILFPKESADVSIALAGIGISESQIIDFDTAELARRKTQKQQDVNSISTNDNYANAAFDTPLPTLTRSQSAKLYKYLKIWGSDESNINQIGLSPVIEDTNQYKQTMYTTANYEKEAFGIEPTEEIPDPLDKTLKFQYPQGEKISNIIQDVVLNSKYIQDSLDQDRDDGNKAFFKIEQMVFIEDESPINSDIGRPRMTYVYNVVPYFVDESKVAAPNEVGKNTSGKKAVAPKEYSYMYTGKNEDVLDFNINFNASFYELVLADLNTGTPLAGNSTVSVPSNTPNVSKVKSTSNNEVTSSVALASDYQSKLPNGAQLTPEQQQKRLRAEYFHDRVINSPINMVSAELVIWGDPFYIPSDLGNNRARTISMNIDENAKAATGTNELLLVVNFRTPLDYPQLNGQFIMDMPELVKPFSGLFQVVSVNHTFDSGQFRQSLQLIRRPRQTDKPTGTTGVSKSSENINRGGAR